MGRMIDADKSKADLEKAVSKNEDMDCLDFLRIASVIDKQPTAYDPDKVVEQLENERKFWENAYNRNLGKEKARSYEHAIEIVKGGGINGD